VEEVVEGEFAAFAVLESLLQDLVAAGLILPGLNLQALDFVEMGIAGDQNQVVLLCDGSNPKVILRDWPSHLSQLALDGSIPSRRLCIAHQYCAAGGEVVHSCQILFDSCGLASTEVEFSQNNAGDEYLFCSLQTFLNGRFPSEESNDDVGVQEEPTIHPG